MGAIITITILAIDLPRELGLIIPFIVLPFGALLMRHSVRRLPGSCSGP